MSAEAIEETRNSSTAAIGNTVQPAIPREGDPLLDPAAVLRLLRNRVPGLATRLIANCTVWPLKTRFRSRRVIAIDITMAGPGGDETMLHWIAKTRTAGTDAVAEFRALSELTRAGFEHTSRFRVPRPICLMPDWRLFVEERASGDALRTFLGSSTGSPALAMRMAAQWLRQLHSLPPPREAECEYDNENLALGVFTENLRSQQPWLARYLDREGARLRDQFAGWRGVSASLIHGDFHPENVYVSRDAVTVIDFDRFAIGDPAKDLGSFIAQVRAMSYFSKLPAGSTQEIVRTFLEEYVRGIPSNQAQRLLERVAGYIAFFALEVGYYTLCVLRVSDPVFARDWFLDGTGRPPAPRHTLEQAVQSGGPGTWEK